MSVDNLTFGEIKELVNLFNGNGKAQPSESAILKSAIGKYCIVRTRNEGINCGLVVDADETGVVLEDARRIHYHKPKDKETAWYEGVAESGVSEDSRLSCAVERKYIIEDYSLTICTEAAEESLRTHEAHKTTC